VNRVPACRWLPDDSRGCSNWAVPDAPGLVSFGAQLDSTVVDPLHAGSPMAAVSGVGVSVQEAFQGCIDVPP